MGVTSRYWVRPSPSPLAGVGWGRGGLRVTDVPFTPNTCEIPSDWVRPWPLPWAPRTSRTFSFPLLPQLALVGLAWDLAQP